MFTGIISAVGTVTAVEALGADATFGKRLTISTPAGFLQGVQIGDSIAVQGACMTVVSLQADSYTFDMSAESLRLVTGVDQLGQAVNLEKALRMGDPLGGHMVSGHVDGMAPVQALDTVGESLTLVIDLPRSLAMYCVHKGSITINGVSLTINQLQDLSHSCRISINLIPHTATHTTLGQLRAGSVVNIEVDTIARHVARMLEAYTQRIKLHTEGPSSDRGHEDGMLV